MWQSIALAIGLALDIVGVARLDPAHELAQLAAGCLDRVGLTSGAAALKAAETKPLGRQTFGLVSLDASTRSGAHDGHKVEARGLIYRDGAYADINLTSLKTLAPTCAR